MTLLLYGTLINTETPNRVAQSSLVRYTKGVHVRYAQPESAVRTQKDMSASQHSFRFLRNRSFYVFVLTRICDFYNFLDRTNFRCKLSKIYTVACQSCPLSVRGEDSSVEGTRGKAPDRREKYLLLP